jgi:hypothetical protein
MWKDGRVWNSFPGGLMTLSDYCDTPSQLPWNGAALLQQQQQHQPLLPTGTLVPSFTNISQFTALIYAQQSDGPSSSNGPLLHLLRVVSRSQHVQRVSQNSFSKFKGTLAEFKYRRNCSKRQHKQIIKRV